MKFRSFWLAIPTRFASSRLGVILLGALCALSPAAAHARLGESPKAICLRYGPVKNRVTLSTNLWTARYDFGRYTVRVWFADGLSVAEMVIPQTEGAEIADAERESLLEKIVGIGWRPLEPKAKWHNDQAKASAILTDRRSILVVIADDFLPIWLKHSHDKERARTSGF